MHAIYSPPESDLARLSRIETRYASAAATLLLQVTVWQRLAVTTVRSIVRRSTNWLKYRYHLLLSVRFPGHFCSVIKDDERRVTFKYSGDPCGAVGT